jgi:hypothetical protein
MIDHSDLVLRKPSQLQSDLESLSLLLVQSILSYPENSLSVHWECYNINSYLQVKQFRIA